MELLFVNGRRLPKRLLIFRTNINPQVRHSLIKFNVDVIYIMREKVKNIYIFTVSCCVYLISNRKSRLINLFSVPYL
jgi:hypothetical protein